MTSDEIHTLDTIIYYVQFEIQVCQKMSLGIYNINNNCPYVFL